MGLAVASTLGCASAGSVEPVTGMGLRATFPSPERLREIAAQPRPSRSDPSAPTIAVERWELAPPEPDTADAAPALEGTPAPLRLTPELTCAAREIGRFMARRGGFPDQRLQSHVLGECGASVAEHTVQAWSFQTHGAPSDQQLLAQLADPLREQLGRLPAHPHDVGSALVRDGDRAVFVNVTARRYVELDPLPAIAADGSIEVSGRLLVGAAALFGLITRGSRGFERCAMEPELELPRFRMRCQLAQEDDAAWIDLQLREPARLLVRSAVRVRARRHAARAPFQAPALSVSVGPESGLKSDAGKLVSLINALRREEGLAPLTLAERQSEQHRALAPFFFDSSRKDSRDADDIALGLIAGWEVPGVIQEGAFYGLSLQGTTALERWLAYLLEFPMARSILFEPRASVLAIGPLVDPRAPSFGVLLSTYTFHDVAEQQRERQRLVESIARLRRAAGSAVARVRRDPELEAAAQEVREGIDPRSALNDAMAAIAERDGSHVQGLVLEAISLDELELPAYLGTQQPLDYALEVTHIRYPGAAWGTLVVLVVTTKPPAATASGSLRPRG